MSDQGESYLAQGCTQCGVWHGEKQIRPAFVITERYGHRYWTCPMCEGSYGEVDSLAASASVRGLATEASPDVAKMVEKAKQLVGGACGSWRVARGDDSASAEEIQLRAFAAIDALGAAATQATPAATEAMGEGAMEVAGPSGDVPSDFQEGQWWLAKLDELVAHDGDGKRAVATVRNLMRTAHAQASRPAAPAEPVAQTFDDAWSAEVKANNGVHIGADYRHWMLRGWNYAVMAHAAPVSADAQKAVAREPLTDAQIEKGREDTFSTNNPFCPCDSKTMLKAVRWAERTLAKRWGIRLSGMTFEESITITQEFRDNDNPF